MSTKLKNEVSTPNRLQAFWSPECAKTLGTLAVKESMPLQALGGSRAKEMLVALTKRALRSKRDETVRQIEEELRPREDVRNALCARDCFRNLPPGVLAYVTSTTDVLSGMKQTINGLSNRYRLFEFAALQPIDYPDDRALGAPGPVDELSELIDKEAARGVMIHVMAPIRPGTYEELLTRQLDNGLLGTAPGRDAIMAFPQRICDVERDKGLVTAHTLVGAALGRRVDLDLRYGMAEPLAGDRNEGDGPKGGLAGGALVETYTEEQRSQLSCYGLTLARSWYQVGAVVIVTNRSLFTGDSAYIFASTTRQRQQVQAIFHETAERNVQNAGRRDGGPLEKTMGDMNTYLGNLQKEGWITEGQVSVDYSSLVVVIHVAFVPALPIDSIVLEYRERPESFDDKH